MTRFFSAVDKRLFWIYALCSGVYFTQGIEALPSQSLFYYLKETLNFSPEKIMLITSITTLAWLVKPPIGYIVDNFLSKRKWIFIALAFDIALVMALGLVSLPLAILIAMMILTSTNSAFRDVAVDGIMCVEGKALGLTGKIQSVQWTAILIAGMFSGAGGGYIAERWGYQTAFLCLAPVYVLVGVSAYFYKEPRKPIPGTHNLIHESRERVELSNVSPELRQNAPAGLIGDLKKLFFHKKLLIVSLFIFLYRFSPSFGTPLFFIQRDVFGWSKMRIGWLTTLGIVFSIAGALVYYRASTRIKIKKWLYVSVFAGAVTSLSYLYYTPVSAIVYDVFYSFAGMFIFLMLLDFMARNAISGLEATSFAFLTSVSNLALVSSNFAGAFLLPVLGLKWLIIISSLTSFLCLLLINRIE